MDRKLYAQVARFEPNSAIYKTITKNRNPNDWIVMIDHDKTTKDRAVGIWVRRGAHDDVGNGKPFNVKLTDRKRFKLDIGTGSGFKVEFDLTVRGN